MTTIKYNKHIGSSVNGCIVGEEVTRNGRQVKLNATCICGNNFQVWKSSLFSGKTTNCGCIRKAKYVYNELKPVHTSWRTMLRRCYYTKNASYARYGGRGITVCEDWKTFKNFENWANDNGFVQGLQLDRINNDGNYEPSNCRFVTAKVNSSNKSNNTHVWLDGMILTAAEASRQLGHSQSYVSKIISGKYPNKYFPRLITEIPVTNTSN